jgi:hypothetical protein
MRESTLNLVFGIGLLLLVTLACNYSFTTAKISSIKVTKESGSATEASTFEPKDRIFVAAVISKSSHAYRVMGRLLYDDVKGQDAGKPVPAAEIILTAPGGSTASFNFTPPSSGWQGGSYKVEITIKNDNDVGEQIDQKTAPFSVSGASPSADSTAAQSSVRLTRVIMDSQMEGEPDAPKTTFSPSDTIYVFYEFEGAPPATKFYCNLYTENAEGFGPDTLLRALSFTRTTDETSDRFDLDPKKEEDGQTIWASGTYRIELSYSTDAQTSPKLLKTLNLTVR